MILKIFQGKLEGPGRCYKIPGKFLGGYASKFLAQAKVNSREEPKCHIPMGTGPCACRLKRTWGNEPGGRNISTEG